MNVVCVILAMDLDITKHSNSDTSSFNSLQQIFTSEDGRGLIFHMVIFFLFLPSMLTILDGFQMELM
jgi:hypothetical protein